MNAVDRAAEIVSAVEWEGDMGVNMTRIIGAGRVLLREVERLQRRIEELEDRIRKLEGRV